MELSLSPIFREHCPEPASTDDALLDAALRGLFDEGARAWPALPLLPEVFVRHLASFGAPKSAAPLFDGLYAADLFLACACATRVQGAIEAFDRVHASRVAAALARMRPPPELVDEVRQMVREKLLVGRDGAPPKIAEYDGCGALASLVRVVAVRAAIDLRRHEGVVAGAREERSEPRGGDPEIEYMKERYRRAFDDAFRGAIRDLPPELREILRLHFVDGQTLDQLAAKLGVHRATVARRVAAAREAVADAARRRLHTALGANKDELESLLRMMRGEIDVSLRRLLGESA